MAVRFDIITIFPGMFSSVVDESILGRAVKSGLVEIQRVECIRDATHATAQQLMVCSKASICLGGIGWDFLQ